MPQHTTRQLTPLLGRRGLLDAGKGGPLGRLAMLVDVLDARQCWDRVDCLVRPVAGDGTAWVSADRLSEPTDEILQLSGAGRAVPAERLALSCN